MTNEGWNGWRKNNENIRIAAMGEVEESPNGNVRAQRELVLSNTKILVAI